MNTLLDMHTYIHECISVNDTKAGLQYEAAWALVLHSIGQGSCIVNCMHGCYVQKAKSRN